MPPHLLRLFLTLTAPLLCKCALRKCAPPPTPHLILMRLHTQYSYASQTICLSYNSTDGLECMMHTFPRCTICLGAAWRHTRLSITPLQEGKQRIHTSSDGSGDAKAVQCVIADAEVPRCVALPSAACTKFEDAFEGLRSSASVAECLSASSTVVADATSGTSLRLVWAAWRHVTNSCKHQGPAEQHLRVHLLRAVLEAWHEVAAQRQELAASGPNGSSVFAGMQFPAAANAKPQHAPAQSCLHGDKAALHYRLGLVQRAMSLWSACVHAKRGIASASRCGDPTI